jgi:hypothetical protein
VESAWLAGNFYVEIRAGGERIGLDTFDTAHKAEQAYDATGSESAAHAGT